MEKSEAFKENLGRKRKTVKKGKMIIPSTFGAVNHP